jgi:hypothetical protein
LSWTQQASGSEPRRWIFLRDWGAFLEVQLYRDAQVHFLGGADVVSRPVRIFNGPRQIGTQTLNLLNDSVALAVTAKHKDIGAMRDQLGRLLRHTHLTRFQWVNFNHHSAEFTTLAR